MSNLGKRPLLLSQQLVKRPRLLSEQQLANRPVLNELYKRVAERKALLSPSETRTFTITPPAAATFGVISAIRVQDIATGEWYNWDAPGPFTPSLPIVTVGSGTLYIAFWVINQGDTGDLTLTIKDDDGNVLETKTVSCARGAGVGLEAPDLDMPNRPYGITVTVTP